MQTVFDIWPNLTRAQRAEAIRLIDQERERRLKSAQKDGTYIGGCWIGLAAYLTPFAALYIFDPYSNWMLAAAGTYSILGVFVFAWVKDNWDTFAYRPSSRFMIALKQRYETSKIGQFDRENGRI